MKITHHDLMQLGTLLGYLNFDKGLCAGFSGMWAQAILVQDENTFYKRLAFIATYKNNFSHLVAEIKEAQQKQNKNLNEKEVQLLDILAFLDGVEVYLIPNIHRNFFPEGPYVNQEDIQAIFSLVKPLTINESTIEVLLDKDYSFTKVTLTHFFEDLAQLLSLAPSTIPILLNSGNHSVCLKYNSQKSCWDYADTNDFVKFSDVEQYFRELDTQALVDSVFTSFKTNSYAVFNTKLITNYKEDKLKKSLQKLNLKYPIRAEEANNTNSNGVGLLYIACQKGHTDITKELLKSEYKVNIDKADNNGVTPFFIACYQGHLDIIKELLKPEYKVDINKADNNGVTPFYIACQEGHTDIINELLKPEYKVDINKADDDEATPFFIACQQGHLDIIKELLKPEYNVDINKADNNGVTPFYMACQQGHTEVVKEILALPHFAQIDAIGPTGRTPLLSACLSPLTKDKRMLFKELLKCGANITHKNDEDQTALDIAFSIGNLEAINELLQMAKIKRYSPITIMSSATLEKAKDWAKLNPEHELNSYLQPLGLNNKLAFFYNYYKTKQPEMGDGIQPDAEGLWCNLI